MKTINKMKFNILLLRKPSLILLLVAIVTSHLKVNSLQNVLTQYYQQSDFDFPNPERGFFISLDPLDNKPRSPLKLSQLQGLRERNITLVRRIYLLSEFREQPLSESLLNKVAADLVTAQEAGVKLILRFSYNWLGGGEDATQERIIAHLQQLKPILQDNYAALAYIEAGFIGYWGEWNKSSHGLGENPQARKTILNKILSVLPSERMVAIRYSHHKRDALEDPLPLQASEAFNHTKKARIGAHNDCFLASIDDGGTYSSTRPEKIAQQKAFLQQDNLFVVQGGELCKRNPPQTNCDRALTELEQMRWSALNYYPPPQDLHLIFQDWQQQGCLPEISRRLGYRFRLTESKIARAALLLGIFDLEFTVANDGWASLYNSRKLEVILRHKSTDREYYLVTSENPQFWQPAKQNTVKVSALLPTDLPSGDYQILLNLPDPHPHLYNLPEYSIRLANQDIWEPHTGYNLLQQITVIPLQHEDGNTMPNSFRFRQRGDRS